MATSAKLARLVESDWKFTGDVDISAGTVQLPSGGVTRANLASGLVALETISQRIQHSDLTDEDGAQTIALTGFPTNAVPVAAWVELDTAFSGGTASAVTVKVGDAGDDDELLAATSVFTGVAAGILSAEGAATGKFRHEAAYSPAAVFTVTDDTCANLTAGDLRVHLVFFRLAQAS